MCDATLASPETLGPYTLDFVQGIVWGAAEQIRSLGAPPDRYAAAWEPLATRALAVALSVAHDDVQLEGMLQGVMIVLETRWSPATRARLYGAIAPLLTQVIQKATLGDVSWLHFLLGNELTGEIEGNQQASTGPLEKLPLAATDQVLLGFCKASAERVLEWAKQKATTSDLGWVSMLSGRDTAELIRKVYLAGRDKAYLQRALAPIVDLLGEAGFTDVATDLRLMLRRGSV